MGVETISEFFTRLHFETQVGCSPSVLRGRIKTLEAMMLERGKTWKHEGGEAGEVREIIGGVDETFL